jgi:hypothetical protein
MENLRTNNAAGKPDLETESPNQKKAPSPPYGEEGAYP